MALGKTRPQGLQRYAERIIVAIPIKDYSFAVVNEDVSAIVETGGTRKRVEVPIRCFDEETKEIQGLAEGLTDDGRTLVRFPPVQDGADAVYVYDSEVRVLAICESCGQELPKERRGQTRFTVNDMKRITTARQLTYDDIMKRVRGKTEIPYTVTYTNGPDEQPEGLLAPGEEVKVKRGMAFTAVVAGVA